MSHLTRDNSKAEDIEEIVSAIHGIARLVNEDLARKPSANTQPFLGETELGDLMLAVEHLCSYAEGIAEDIGEGKS
ncbi:hypothetical protein [Halomonas sp. M4R1S46]|uniref:hypothetical protein n=1 Tax=Halomonas sp. M4R1S46 TaxID=2982692 RepID=UPI0021E37EFD|nr:hypothetical protein [Halomonas sp. M4R1S46]UYG08380.1 hypothetical protein OCT48_03295 [Halomonas sp. M4R1S46]